MVLTLLKLYVSPRGLPLGGEGGPAATPTGIVRSGASRCRAAWVSLSWRCLLE